MAVVETNGTILDAPPILVYILVGIESDVHWGYDLDFDPWPFEDECLSFPVRSNLNDQRIAVQGAGVCAQRAL